MELRGEICWYKKWLSFITAVVRLGTARARGRMSLLFRGVNDGSEGIACATNSGTAQILELRIRLVVRDIQKKPKRKRSPPPRPSALFLLFILLLLFCELLFFHLDPLLFFLSLGHLDDFYSPFFDGGKLFLAFPFPFQHTGEPFFSGGIFFGFRRPLDHTAVHRTVFGSTGPSHAERFSSCAVGEFCSSSISLVRMMALELSV